MKKIVSSLILVTVILGVFAVVFSFSSAPVYAQSEVGKDPGWKGIVPCGRNEGTAEETAPCTLCHFILGFQRLVQYGLYMVITLALVGIFFAGVMYVMAAGDEGMMSSAKGFMKASLIGFAVVLLGWLTVSITMWVLGAKGDLGVIPSGGSWWKFSCSTKSSAGSGENPSTGGKWKCALGTCSQASNGTYNSKEECEKSPTCKTTCSDYHFACNDTTPCCDTTQKCVQNPSLAAGKKWCAKDGEESNCGQNNAGICQEGRLMCPSGQTRLFGGNDCGSGFVCCAADLQEGNICGSGTKSGTCQKLSGSSCPDGQTRFTPSNTEPQCASGMDCCYRKPKPVDWYINPESGKVVISGDSVDYVVTLYDKNDKDGYIYSCSIDGKSGLRGDMESALNCRVHGTAGQKGKYSLILTATPIDPMGGGSSSTKELSVEVK